MNRIRLERCLATFHRPNGQTSIPEGEREMSTNRAAQSKSHLLLAIAGLLALWTAGLGCGGAVDVAGQSSALALDTNATTGFEAVAGWTASAGTASSTAQRTQGAAAHQLTDPANETVLTSAPIAAVGPDVSAVQATQMESFERRDDYSAKAPENHASSPPSNAEVVAPSADVSVTPLREPLAPPGGPCKSGRCMGTEPTAPVSTSNLVRTGMHERGTNTQMLIPQNLQLADIDADGYSDFIQYANNKIVVSKTDFYQTGILQLYAGRPIKRVLVGDFHGDHNQQTCVITDDNALACYGISTDRRSLWWWFTQATIVGDSEDAIVGDFDGDGRDDVLVYPRWGGAYRMYSIKGGYFFNPTPAFVPGNLGTASWGLQLRAGDFNGDGRDDLFIVNSAGQIIYLVSVFDGTNQTFWWAFTTVGGFVGSYDQVTVARIDDNGTDDIALHNRVTGATRFYRMEYNYGSPPAITTVSNGQIDTNPNTLLFWGYMHGALAEPGAYYRDDTMMYELGWNGLVRTDARWDGTRLTYWWAYTQYAPTIP